MQRRSSLTSIIMASIFLPQSCFVPTASATPVLLRRASYTAEPVPEETYVNASPEPAVEPACTTIMQFQGYNLGPTSTVYASTATSTSTVDCGPGCNAVTVDSARYFNHGPVAQFETTITLQEATTTTVFACGATASASTDSVAPEVTEA